MTEFFRTLVLGFTLAFAGPALVAAAAAPADEIAGWNQMLFRAALVGASSPLVTTRVAAIVEAAVFDATNGIGGRYAPIHVAPAAPLGASREAAAVQAAYATLVALFPTQKATFDAKRAASLTSIGTRDNATAIANGIAWGQKPLPTPSWRGAAPMDLHRPRRPLSAERASVNGARRRLRWRPARDRSLPT